MIKNEDITIQFLGREFGLIVRDKLKESGFHLVEDGQQADLLVVGFYGKILSQEMIEAPKYGVLNVHPSLLPKYRGPTPVPTAILNGDKETGVTIMQLDQEVDHGPILAQQTVPTGENEYTTPELRQILWELGADMLVEIIPKWIAGEIKPKEQDHAKATYTQRLTREHGKIDWNKGAAAIARQIRAYYPWPGTHTTWQGKMIKILKGTVKETTEQHTPGTVVSIDKGFGVATGKGILVIEELQMEGKKPISAPEFLLGYKDFITAVLK